MGGMVTITHEACPECTSTDVKPYWWHRGKAWIIICDECKHEEGRESSEWQAWEVWDAAARDALAKRGSTTEGGEPPSVVPGTEAAVPAEFARRPPLRTYWHCAWSSRQQYDREGGRKVVSTGKTLVVLYEDMAARRIAHLYDEDDLSQVIVGHKPSGETVFCYGPVRLMAVYDERTFDLAAVEASEAWTGFHARQEAHERRRAEMQAAFQAEQDSRAEERERAEYERLRAKFGTAGEA